jgi:hypothetical protein
MFSVLNLQINRGKTTANAQGQNITTILHSYKDKASTIANILAYFPPFFDQGVDQEVIQVGDIFIIDGSDTVSMAELLSLSPVTFGPNLFLGQSVTLSVGAPIAAVDGNAARITGDTLQMEIADITHPGIVSATTQDFGGAKTFHNNVGIALSDIQTGLTITKPTGNFGINMITTDTSSVAAMNISNTTAPASFFGIRYKEDGFVSANPELQLFAGSATSLTLDDVAGKMTVSNILSTDTITQKTLLAGTTINGTNVKGTTIALANPFVFWDDGTVLINTVRFGLDSTDYLSYDKTSNTFLVNVASTPIFAVNPTSGLQTDVGLDRITPGALNIGSTNATLINLAKDTSLAAGHTFTANAIDSTTAVPLVIGATTATAITLGENTNVSSGKILTTDALDSTSAAPLVIGGTNATAITLDENTTITATHVLSTNSIDAISAVPLVLGATQASQITLDENTVVSSGKTLSVNTIDATSAGAITIGAGTSTGITLAENTTITSGLSLFVDTIDNTPVATTLTIGGTNSTAITLVEPTTFNIGATFPTTGGTATQLNYYENTTHSTTFTTAGVTSASQTLQLTRIGNKIIIRIPALTIAIAGPGTCVSNTALPTRYRPAAIVQWAEVVQDVGVNVYGRFQITTGGIFNIGVGAAGGNFAIGNSGWQSSIQLSYTIQ